MTAVAMSIRRREVRSLAVPPPSINTERGRAASITMASRMMLDPVSESTSQGDATRENWSPVQETALPIQSKRNAE